MTALTEDQRGELWRAMVREGANQAKDAEIARLQKLTQELANAASKLVAVSAGMLSMAAQRQAVLHALNALSAQTSEQEGGE